jgi:predicted acetyltransferase
MRPQWTAGVADGTIQIRHMLAVDPAAAAALWRYVIDFELSGRASGWSLPVDDPLQHWLEDPRSGTRQIEDQLYVKLLDIGTALTRRTFTTPVDVVLDVSDDDVPENAGRWRVSGDASGATCERTADAADLSMDVRSLAAAYLGGPTFLEHQSAGWVEEHTRGAAAAASAAFRNDPAPYSPFVF